MEVPPPIYRLPVELLTKIIVENIARPQWPALELVDPDPPGLFHKATLLAWESVRVVDIERDFIYSSIDNDHDSPDEIFKKTARKTESILKKLIDHSPLITSLSGVSLMSHDRSLNTAAVRYLSRFEHLETIKFTTSTISDSGVHFYGDIDLIDLTEFLESTRSRATLKEISTEECHIPNDAIEIGQFARLRLAFANASWNYPDRRSLLKLESLSIGEVVSPYGRPIAFLITIDTSRLTQLSLGIGTPVDPAVLTILIQRAPRLQHLDFAFLRSCKNWSSPPACHGRRRESNKELLIVLGSHQNLRSLEFNQIWMNHCDCQRFELEFRRMLYTIGPRLENFVLKTSILPFDIHMCFIRDIIRDRMPRLKSLKLRVRDVDAGYFMGIDDDKKLKAIHLDTCFGDWDNEVEIANYVLSMIAYRSPRLQRFVMPNIDVDHHVVIALCKLEDLIELRIRGRRLTEENFRAFAEQVHSWRKLEVLCLGDVQAGVEDELIRFISRARNLRLLVVHKNVTDRLLRAMAYCCPKLEKFRATSPGLTFEGVQMLVDGCPKLRWLEVDDTTDTLRRSLGNLRFGHYRKPLYNYVCVDD